MKLVCNILYIKKKEKYLRFLITFIIIILFITIINYLVKKNNLGAFTIVNNCDYFSLGISIKKYSKIIDFIARKFFMKNRDIINNKKKISISTVNILNYTNYTDFFINMLKDDFVIDFNNTYPDYLFYDVFGCEHLNQRYNNSIKIAYYTENKIPDFHQADYALSQAHINYLDRYYRYPSIIWHLSNNNLININKNRRKVNERKKFCAAIISNNVSSDNFRLNFIRQLNKYKLVDMAGKVFNNIGKVIEKKIEFLSSYKFSIAMENSNGDGYASEKIIDSFISGTIPIYYGDYMIDEYINPKAYILIKGEKDIQEKIDYIKKIDNNKKLYKKFLRQKLFINSDISNTIESEKNKFIYHIFKQDKKLAKRIDNDDINYNFCF
jgi:hypothetical protein